MSENESSSESEIGDGTASQQGGGGKAPNNRWRTWVKEWFTTAFNKCAKDVWLSTKPPDRELCQNILEMFPTDPGISVEDIQVFIQNMCLRVQSLNRTRGHTFDKWIEVIEAVSPDENNIAKQLRSVMLVAEQEPPDPEPLRDTINRDLPLPDFSAIYNYLSKAFSDEPLPELSPIDSLVVEECMQSLSFQIESLHDSELRQSLRKVYLHLVQNPEEEHEPDHDDMRKSLLHNATILNPLGINAQAIVPVVPK